MQNIDKKILDQHIRDTEKVLQITERLCNSLLKLRKSKYIASPYSLRTFGKSGLSLQEFIKKHDDPFIIPDFNRIDERDAYYREHCDIIPVPKKYMRDWLQYKFLESLPQPVQKSPEWFAARNEVISASSGAHAIDELKYEPSIEMLKSKVGLGKPFIENMHVHHGKKLEYIATAIYEYIYNVKVGEFGLVPHVSKPHISFLAASPDGICTNSTLDGKFSPFVGRMLEIKCVTYRKINDTGPEHVFVRKGEKDFGICPHYYWIQMQLQLECCDLEYCDFWQCKLKNYWSSYKLQQIINETETVHIREQGNKYTIDPKLEYGTLIELEPIDLSIVPEGHKPEWYGAYIYPDRMDTDLDQKIEWAVNMKKNWKTLYPEYAKDYKFGKILYYHLPYSHCYLVKRNRKWFRETLPRFREFWDKVLEYRNDPELRKTLIDDIAMKESINEQNAMKENIENEKKRMSTNDMDSDED